MQTKVYIIKNIFLYTWVTLKNIASVLWQKKIIYLFLEQSITICFNLDERNYNYNFCNFFMVIIRLLHLIIPEKLKYCIWKNY